MTLAPAAVLFFPVMDPLGNIPFFAAALAHVAPQRRGRVVIRELPVVYGVVYGVVVGFLCAGRSLLQISEPALTIASVILFLIALRMVFPSERPAGEGVAGEPFVVPLAVPYVAGPSLLASELLLTSREPARWPEWWLALTASWVACSVLVLLGSKLGAYPGRRGFVALERPTGMVLVAITVQMFLSGVERFAADIRKAVERPAQASVRARASGQARARADRPALTCPSAS